MLISPTRAALVRRAALTAALSSTLALVVPQPATAEHISGPGSIVLAYSDEALPGEGRPPLPGPTDPHGPLY
jgi:hypothetical protein